MTPHDAASKSFSIRTAGRLVGNGKRTATVGRDGITLEPGGHFTWAEFTGYRGALPNTLIHRNGRSLLISPAANNSRGHEDVRACLQAMAAAIAAFNAGRAPEAQLLHDVQGEMKAARRQRAGAFATAGLCVVMFVIALVVPAPMPVMLYVLPVLLAVSMLIYGATMDKRVRELSSGRRAPGR